MAVIRGIHHVSMRCRSGEEYEKTVRFYRDVLGLKVARAWEKGIMFDSGAGLIELFADADKAMEKGVIQHFAFAVDDADACVKAVTEAGYEVFMGPKDVAIPSEPVFPARVAFCYGPLGEEIEFFQEK